jgi:Arc/MetJ-type ribon-helix-helix transcriptional regulator
MVDRKTKTVSLRMSPKEYRQLREACASQEIGSVSDLVRTAMQNLIASNGSSTAPLHRQVQELRYRLDALSVEVERLSHDSRPERAAFANLG